MTETTGETYSTEYIEPDDGQDHEGRHRPDEDKHPDGEDSS